VIRVGNNLEPGPSYCYYQEACSFRTNALICPKNATMTASAGVGVKTTKEMARNVIADVAPGELELFETIWAEQLKNPQLLRAEGAEKDRQLGAGVDFSMASLISLVVIPVVVDLAKNAAMTGVSSIVKYVKDRLGNRDPNSQSLALSQEDIDRIASAVAVQFANKG
jgi:hypothetical protein